MSRRGGTVYEERDYYSREGPPPAPPPPPPAPVRTRERERDYEEVDTYSRREREPERGSRPDFLREDYGRPDPGQLVVRERKEETSRRPRSPSPTRSVYRERVITRSPSPPPVRIREQRTERVIQRSPSPPPPVRIREQRTERIIQKSPSPPPFERVRIIERERERSPTPPPERLRARVVETRERIRERSPSPVRSIYRERVVERERTPSPPPVRIRERIVERERERSPSPPRVENIRIRNFERRPSPSPSPSPSPPPTIRAPPIHQEIITHHRHIDHGFEIAHVPSPPPPPRRREKETDIDIHTSRNNTEIDIKQTSSRSRTPQPTSTSLARREKFYDDDSSIFEGERDTLKVRDTKFDISSRRSVSARPDTRERERVRVDIRDDESEGDYYRRRADERAYIGEAYNGATKDWAIVDVPPGTERVQLDGVGGGSEEITWQRYNGVRRSKFIPERDRFPERAPERIPERLPERGVERERERIEIRDDPRREGTGMEIEISSSRRREGGGSYEREYERIEESSDRRIGMPRPPPKARDESLWTEITKDLVSREAIEEMGYDFEETEFFFYIIQYLKYEDVLELVKITEKIRRERQERIREIERERERIERRDRERDEWERFSRRKEREVPAYDDERIIEREIIYEGGRRGPPPRRGGGW